jgi:hypothetical protein
MALMKDLLEKPPALTTASKYTALNGVAYLVVGVLLIVWPGGRRRFSWIQLLLDMRKRSCA